MGVERLLAAFLQRQARERHIYRHEDKATCLLPHNKNSFFCVIHNDGHGGLGASTISIASRMAVAKTLSMKFAPATNNHTIEGVDGIRMLHLLGNDVNAKKHSRKYAIATYIHSTHIFISCLHP